LYTKYINGNHRLNSIFEVGMIYLRIFFSFSECLKILIGEMTEKSIVVIIKSKGF